jgi:sorting and assembly machinery component 37
LDLEAVEEKRKSEQAAAVAAGQLPRNLIQRPRDTVSSLLGKTTLPNQFKLEALTAEFFESLEQLLDGKSYLLSDEQPCSLDAFVVGYCSLMVIPELPFAWLRNAANTKSPRLAQYIERMRQRCYGVVAVSDAFRAESTTAPQIPWQPPERATVHKIGGTLIDNLADATPILREFRRNSRLRESLAGSSSSDFSAAEKRMLSQYATASRKDLYLSIGSVAAGVATLIGYMFHVGLLTVTRKELDHARGKRGQGANEK